MEKHSYTSAQTEEKCEEFISREAAAAKATFHSTQMFFFFSILSSDEITCSELRGGRRSQNSLFATSKVRVENRQITVNQKRKTRQMKWQ